MKIHLLAGARSYERAPFGLRSALLGHGVANLTLPSLAALIPRRHQVTIQDEQAAPLDLGAPMDLALITVKACYAPRTYEIAARLRARGVPVVMGGCHVTLDPDEAAAHCDAVVLGEAEALMPRLLEDAEHGRLEPRYQGQQADMTLVPPPRRELLQKRYLIDAVLASRGCNHGCRFCCVRSFYGQGHRSRPVGAVVQELRRLGSLIGFLDENLAADLDAARELFTAMVPLRKRWLGSASVDILQEPELISLAGKAGAQAIFFGLETVNPTNLTAMGKTQNDVSAYRELVDRCHRAGIAVGAGMIFGLDADTEETFAETLEVMRTIGVDLGYFKIATPYPGTAFHRQLAAEDRILSGDWSFYDGCFPTYIPKGMSPRQLFEGVCWIRRRFYSAGMLAGRLRRYLGLNLPLWALLNLNRMARTAYRQSELLGGQFLREVGQ